MKKVVIVLVILMVIASPVFCKTSSFLQFDNPMAVSAGTASSPTGLLDDRALRISLGQTGFSNWINNPFKGVFSFYNQMIVGVVAGALFGLKFAIELLNAVMNEDSNPKGVKRCMLRLLLHVGVVGFGSVGVLGLLGVIGVA